MIILMATAKHQLSAADMTPISYRLLLTVVSKVMKRNSGPNQLQFKPVPAVTQHDWWRVELMQIFASSSLMDFLYIELKVKVYIFMLCTKALLCHSITAFKVVLKPKYKTIDLFLQFDILKGMNLQKSPGIPDY